MSIGRLQRHWGVQFQTHHDDANIVIKQVTGFFVCLCGFFFFFFFWFPSDVGFTDSSVHKESACIAFRFNSGSGRSAGEGKRYPLQDSWASLVAQLVKNLPAMLKTWIQSLAWEDPLEKGKVTHSSILSWREEPGGLQSMRSKRVRHDWLTKYM